MTVVKSPVADEKPVQVLRFRTNKKECVFGKNIFYFFNLIVAGFLLQNYQHFCKMLIIAVHAYDMILSMGNS